MSGLRRTRECSILATISSEEMPRYSSFGIVVQAHADEVATV
jgi:hypothetical protein